MLHLRHVFAGTGLGLGIVFSVLFFKRKFKLTAVCFLLLLKYFNVVSCSFGLRSYFFFF